METISGLPKPDLTPRQTDVAYTGNRLTTIDTLWTIPPDYPTTGASYAHDAAGNITSDGLHTDYFHNQNNRLIRVEIDGLTVAEYAYDGFERRVKKVVNGVTTHFHYDLNGLLISETDGNGNPRKDYVYLNAEPVAMKTYGGSAGWYCFVNDHLGTPQKMVDAAGNVVWAAAYAPFGEARVYEDEVVNNLRFPGQYYDVETGLHYNWHRYYDPGTGRYLTPDPIGLAGGMNLYAYVQNNPINWVDLWGLERKPGKTPPSRWPQPPTNVVGKKPKWKPEGYWSGKGRKVTWDDRSHGTGVDRGQGPQGGHWDDECSENRWDEEGNPLPGSPDVEKNLEFNIHPGIPTAIGGGVLSVIILIISGGAYSHAS